jgi:hypothetical protein
MAVAEVAVAEVAVAEVAVAEVAAAEAARARDVVAVADVAAATQAATRSRDAVAAREGAAATRVRDVAAAAADVAAASRVVPLPISRKITHNTRCQCAEGTYYMLSKHGYPDSARPRWGPDGDQVSTRVQSYHRGQRQETTNFICASPQYSVSLFVRRSLITGSRHPGMRQVGALPSLCGTLPGQLYRSFLVSFLYSLKAESGICSMCVDEVGALRGDDMVPVVGGSLVTIGVWR